MAFEKFVQTKMLQDHVPLEYVTRCDHPNIPKGTKVTAVRRDGLIWLILSEDVVVKLPGGKFFLAGYETDPIAADFALAH